MKHSVVFDNAQSDWNEALPLGNGVMGSMAFFKDNTLHTVYNHYEVYYSCFQRYSHQYAQDMAEGKIRFDSPTLPYEKLVEDALESYRDSSVEPIVPYRDVIFPSTKALKKAKMQNGMSHPPTGEMDIVLKDAWKEKEDYRLWLSIEDAATGFEASFGEHRLQIDDCILMNEDVAVKHIRQSPGAQAVQSIVLRYPQRRNHEGYTISYHQADGHTFLCRVSFYPAGEDRERFAPFSFVVVTRLVGASGSGRAKDNQMDIALDAQVEDFYILTYVRTELESEQPESEALEKIEAIQADLALGLEDRRRHWQDYFQRSSIEIPDGFLERLWYLNLYILGCCSGKDGRRLEQASGLNGLWDIRQPTLWGSLWYWDVNIQASYWPVYTANHMELAKVFCDGFLAHAPLAEKRAREFYGMEGYAIDYPHVFYNCMGPWCAQFLWWYYEYTLDKEFLREKAYPLFMAQVRFIHQSIRYDEQRDEYYFFPDVSPEQGPLTRNSTITVAVVKYLLEFTQKANGILDADAADLVLLEELYQKLPAYPMDRMDFFGEVIKDSEYANPYSQLRHPSLLMPIYPMGEIGAHSDARWREIGENTINYVSERSELGVFLFGWISCAASRMGKGSTALRVLYERGLDLMLRANGMGAEQTERWENFCPATIDPPPTYHPFMMECVGEVVASVNEMLLQDIHGYIRVFPALPGNEREPVHELLQSLRRVNRNGNRNMDIHREAWQDCSFDRLLARGGFLVSAVYREGHTQRITVESPLGGTCRIYWEGADPVVSAQGDSREIGHMRESNILVLSTQPGDIICIETQGRAKASSSEIGTAPYFYKSHLGRHVFAGKDRNTDTVKKIESFLFDYYKGNEQYNITTPYRFNFGAPPDCLKAPLLEDNYQFDEKTENLFLKLDSSIGFETFRGFGFESVQDIGWEDRCSSNPLWRDFITGQAPNCFKMELTKGEYHLLVICGDREEPSCLVATADNGYSVTLKAPKGEYKAETIPLILTQDRMVSIHLDGDGGPWKLNGLLVRKGQNYL